MSAKPLALVTGAAGFIGRNVIKSLIKDGIDVLAIDSADDTYKNLDHMFGGQLHNVKRMDAIEFFENNTYATFDYAFHFAALVGGRATIEGKPLDIAAKDLSVDAAFFKWLSTANVNKALYPSSSAVYPIKYQTKENETALKEEYVSIHNDRIDGVPDNTYGWVKLTGEFLAYITHKTYHKNIAVIRPFSGYGPDQDLTYPVPAIAQRARNRENPLTIWSNTVRDFVHVDDVVTAIRVVVDNINDGSAINIGSGSPVEFSTIANILAFLEGYAPFIEIKDDKPKGVHTRYCDTSQIYGIGWRPKVTLTDGLRSVLNHITPVIKED